MMEPDLEAYQNAVEGLHGAPARFQRVHRVMEMAQGEVIWEGPVYEFQIDLPEASAAYAWSDPVSGSDRRRFYAVLHRGPVDSPDKAVRAAIVREYQRGAQGDF